MILMRTFLPALGFPLLVLACTPVVRPDPISSGGAGGDASGVSATSAASTTGAGGSGGSGGAAPMGTCSKMAGPPFIILGDQELDGAASLGDKIYLIPDAGKRAMVHVIIEDGGMNRVLVRTLIDDPNPVRNYAQYGAVGQPGFRPTGGRALNGQLLVRGSYGNNVAQLAYTVDPDNGVGVDGMLQILPTPVECSQQGHPDKVVFAPGTNPPRYLVTCLPDAAGMPGALFAGDGTSAPTQLLIKDPSSPEMRPALYTYQNGTHLVIFGGDKGGTFFSYGAKVDFLGGLQPLRLTPDVTTLSGVFATVPLPGDDGIAMISAFFDSSTGKGQFLAGPILASDYGSLAKIPPPGLVPIQNIPLIADVAPIFFPTWDPTGIYGAGASQDNASARFYWFTRDGKPLVFGQSIYTSTGPAILTANAAPLGDINKVVVWVERDDAATPPKYTVKGQKLICQIKS